MQRYETILIIDPDLPEDEIEGIIEGVKEFFAQEGAEIIKVDQWGKRKLVYEIKKKHKGVYVLLDYQGESDIVHKFETKIQIDERIYRCQTIKIDKNAPREITEEVA